MTDEKLIEIYGEGNKESHVAGLRAVYEAGQRVIWERLAKLEAGQVLVEDEGGVVWKKSVREVDESAAARIQKMLDSHERIKQ